MKKYRCEVEISKNDNFVIEAENIDKAKEQFEQKIIEMIRSGDFKIEKYIHQIKS